MYVSELHCAVCSSARPSHCVMPADHCALSGDVCCAEGQLLHQQAMDIKQAAIYVSELRRIGKGLGVFEFDRYLQQDLTEREDGLRPLIHPLKGLAAKAD